MVNDTDISIIQLIKSGEISTGYEISNLKAGQGINIKIRTFLGKTDYYPPLLIRLNSETKLFQLRI